MSVLFALATDHTHLLRAVG